MVKVDDFPRAPPEHVFGQRNNVSGFVSMSRQGPRNEWHSVLIEDRCRPELRSAESINETLCPGRMRLIKFVCDGLEGSFQLRQMLVEALQQSRSSPYAGHRAAARLFFNPRPSGACQGNVDDAMAGNS